MTPGGTEGLPLFREPPTGPPAPVPTREQNRYRAYLQWRASEAGGRAFGTMLRWAREQVGAGAERVSVNALVERARPLYGAINNTWRAWIADDMVQVAPELLGYIERRRRRKVKT